MWSAAEHTCATTPTSLYQNCMQASWLASGSPSLTGLTWHTSASNFVNPKPSPSILMCAAPTTVHLSLRHKSELIVLLAFPGMASRTGCTVYIITRASAALTALGKRVRWWGWQPPPTCCTQLECHSRWGIAYCGNPA